MNPSCSERLVRLGSVFFISLWMVGCGSARVSDRATTNAFRDENYPEAIQRLQKGLADQGEDGKDVLLYLLDLGLAYHASGLYEESNKTFLKADQAAEIKDYTSLSQEAATLLVSDNIKDYKAEDFEYVYISAYLAMNYALMGQLEDAQVEARRMNTKLYRMIHEGKRKYELSVFARYISGIFYESEGDFDNAYVSYKQVKELNPLLAGLGYDLYRTAFGSRRAEDLNKIQSEFSLDPSRLEEEKKKTKRKHSSEIIVFYENGISPEKWPNPQFASVPKFYSRKNPVSFSKVSIKNEVTGLESESETLVLDNIETMAMQNLEDKYGGIIAKKIAGVVAKEAAGYAIDEATGNKGWGTLARLILYAADQADLRSWNLLPKDLQIARIKVEPGTYTVTCNPGGSASEKKLLPKTVQVSEGKKTFVNFRYMP